MATATQPHATPRSVLAAAWSIMLIGGGTSVAFCIYHATHWGSLNLWFALLYGIVPAAMSLCQSHVVAEHRGAGPVVKWITFGLMIGSMSTTVGSTAAVLRPTAGPVLCWLFPLVLDAGALTALFVILNYRTQMAAEADALTAAEAMRAEAAATVIRAEADRDAALEQVASQRAEAERVAGELAAALEADLSGMREELAASAAERDGARAELAAARAEVQGLRSGLNQRRSSGRNPARSSGSGSGRGSGPVRPSGSGPNPEEPADIDTQAEALSIYLAEPEISGSDLGRRLGKSESYGCRLKRELAKTVADPEGSQP